VICAPLDGEPSTGPGFQNCQIADEIETDRRS
jgi:hypothetical protein